MTSYRSVSTLVDFHRVYEHLLSLENYYPDFGTWYWSRAVPDVLHGPGRAILAEERGTVVGVALGRSGTDAKLRCIRVAPEAERRGLACHLIDRLLVLINADRPEFTVPEELIHSYARIVVNRYGFDLCYVERGLYRPGKLEYQFNGLTNHAVPGAF